MVLLSSNIGNLEKASYMTDIGHGSERISSSLSTVNQAEEARGERQA
jgi:hypothetical protein